jgi:gas vesicle protein
MKPEVKTVAKAVGAVVAGAAVGYVAGVLTAPAEGVVTRRKIRRKVEAGAEDLAHKAKTSMKDARGRMVEAIASGEEKVGHAMASLKRA